MTLEEETATAEETPKAGITAWSSDTLDSSSDDNRMLYKGTPSSTMQTVGPEADVEVVGTATTATATTATGSLSADQSLTNKW